MSQKLRILDELGDELQRAANQRLGQRSRRGSVLRLGSEAFAFALVIAVVVVVAVIALRVHPRPSSTSAASGLIGQRGSIVDRNDHTLVASRPVLVIRRAASGLPHSRSTRDAETRRLDHALSSAGLRPGTVFSRSVEMRVHAFELRHQGEFPGVTIGREWVRYYPLRGLAAQVLGTAGPVTTGELRDARFAGVSPGATVGQSGLEWYYDSALRRGETLKLSLDAALQAVGQRALQHSIDTYPWANGGAFVAMNPVDGQIYAMGSLPTYNPNPVARSGVAASNNRALPSNYPLINRAVQSAGPIGSTITPITAIAALQSGSWPVHNVFDDAGRYCFRGQCRHNAGNAVYGVVNIEQAIKGASDDFFYNLGVLTNNDSSRGGALQRWTRLFGIGQPTGIDLGGELTGTLPSPGWLAKRNHLESECDHATGPFTGRPTHPPGGCGIADGTNRPWSPGDNENLAVGQGAIQVTPLQLAVAYSAIANGGTIVRPHLGASVEQSGGTVTRRIDPPPERRLNINPLYLQTIRAGLRAAASQPGGTSSSVMGNFPEKVYGETGTAQYTGQPDYSWYTCFVPPSATSKPIEIVVTVARAGFGVQAAAPVARQIISQWFLGRPGPWVIGGSRAL